MRGAWLAAAAVLVLACSEDNAPAARRGLPPGVEPIRPGGGAGKAAGPVSKAPASRRSGSRRSPSPVPAEILERPDRVTQPLADDSFSTRSRDPFHNHAADREPEAPIAVPVVRAQRDVKLAQYDIDDLRMTAIVNGARNVAPMVSFRAGSDNRSGRVRQGEYFSSSELRLAAVNRDYIEVEVIDPELTPGWNLERGERKVIYFDKQR